VNQFDQHDSCNHARASFSAYLDGAISGREMQAVAQHLEACAECAQEFAALRAMQSVLGTLGTVKPPADLGLKLRLAVSHENFRRESLQNWFSTRWENLVRPMILQVSAGLAGTIVLVGGIAMLLSIVAVPPPVQADDEVMGGLTTPHYLYSAAPNSDIQTDEDTTIVVRAQVNERGQVYDYQVVSGPLDTKTRRELMSQLMDEVFEPARVFGTPVRGQVVVTFAGVSVRG
jgi:anti-sigma factor RsiW